MWVGLRLRGGERSGGQGGEEVSGASRRGPGLGDLGGKSEVRENLANDAGVLDGREQAHAAAAARAGEDVEVKGAPHEVGPRPRAGCAGRTKRVPTPFSFPGLKGFLKNRNMPSDVSSVGQRYLALTRMRFCLVRPMILPSCNT